MHALNPTPWTLRFTEWQCGHHGQRPDDIPVASPAQAKAVLWAIACAISQPGHARAMLFEERRGYTDIYVTDDHCDWEPKTPGHYRPEVVLCADVETAAAILAPELREAREEMVDPDLYQARLWDAKDIPEALVDVNQSVVTLLSRPEVEKLADIDDSTLDPKPPLFELPPIFYDGAEVLARLRKVATDNAAYEAEQAADREREYQEGQAADLKRDEQNLNPGA